MHIVIAPTVSHTREQIEGSLLFREWQRRTFEQTNIRHVTIYRAYWNPPNVGMIQMGITRHGMDFEEAVLLRGRTVDMLTIITDGKRRMVVHVDQYRLPAGHMVRANPSGMVASGESAAKTAIRELVEEVGGDIVWSQPISLSREVLKTSYPLLVTPGGSDEAAEFYVVEGRMAAGSFKQLANRRMGLAHEGERIRLRLTPFEKDIAPALAALGGNPGERPMLMDTKAAMSLLLYDRYLRR